jgi:hypothetical protein
MIQKKPPPPSSSWGKKFFPLAFAPRLSRVAMPGGGAITGKLSRPDLLNAAFESDLNSIQYQWFMALLGRMLVAPQDRYDAWHCFPVVLDESSSSSHETAEQLVNTPSDLMRLVCTHLFPRALEIGTRFTPSDNPIACSLFSLEAADAARMARSSTWICANDFSSQRRHTASVFDLVRGGTLGASRTRFPLSPHNHLHRACRGKRAEELAVPRHAKLTCAARFFFVTL